ncbi:PRC-barrel domain-containing protein [Rhizobium sp. EC-SD404]|uniref:PRC-barrel domain-containing protein n=1 Tax=Rhizobium sp. EC-SD404 TaxID=2038389 RepID=UPI0012558FC1|nr:PRC-barrel domain-containing protein [Rhizobium sp. EC-SD404]VVT15357.1 Photosystem reaction center subunit H [Rhizobium sp. EC-SD404]
MNVSSENIRATRVEGTEVRNSAGEHLGSVNDLVIGKRDGKVKYAIMSFGGFLGIGEEYHPLPWEKLTYDERQGSYIVDLSKDQLEGAPRYAREREFDWGDSENTRRINDYYGVPPYI